MPITRVTVQGKIKDVAKRWMAQQFRGGKWIAPDREAVYKELKALGPKASVEDVVRVMGNDGWISIHCESCGTKLDVAVKVGYADDDEYEMHPATICRLCAQRAANAFSITR